MNEEPTAEELDLELELARARARAKASKAAPPPPPPTVTETGMPAPPGYVGDIRPGESPRDAAARLGGTYVDPFEVGMRASAMREAAQGPALAALHGASWRTAAPAAALGEAVSRTGEESGLPGPLQAPAVLLNPELRERLQARYLRELPRWQERFSGAAERNPAFDLAGAVGGTPLGAAKTALGRIGLSAGQGAVAGLAGGRESALVDPEQAAADAVSGGVLGAAVGAGGEALGAGFRGLGSWASKLKAGLDAASESRIAREVGDAVRSLQGTFRSEVQKGSRLAENLQRVASGVPVTPEAASAVSPEVRQVAMDALRGPGALDVVERVARSSAREMPAQAAAIDTAEQAWMDAVERAPSEIQSRLAEYYAQTPLTPLATWARSQIPRQATAALAGGGLYGLGEATDSTPLRAAGAAAWAGIGAAPGAYRAAQNVFAHPQTAGLLSRAAGSVGRTLQGAESATVLESAASDPVTEALRWMVQRYGETPQSKSELGASAYVRGQGGSQ